VAEKTKLMDLLATKPRLFCRLSLANYHEEINLDEICIARQEAIDYLESQRHNINLFSLNLFLPSSQGNRQQHHNIPQIKKLYREFVDDVASIVSDEGQQNPSWTMFNLITKTRHENEIHSKMKSYFGEIDRIKTQKLIQTARALNGFRTVKIETNREGNLPSRFTFLPPTIHSLEFETLFLQSSPHSHPNPPKDHRTESSHVSESPEELINWLFELTSTHVNQTTNSFDAILLTEEIISAIESSESVDHVQMRLFELVGEDGLHLLMEIIPKYQSIKTIPHTLLKTLLQKKRNLLSYENNSGKKISANQWKKQEKHLQQTRHCPPSSSPSSSSSSAPLEKNIQVTQSIDWLREAGFKENFLEQERMLGLQGGEGGGSSIHTIASPDSWLLDLAPNGTKEYYEKRGLPIGTQRTYGQGYEEVFIPAPIKVTMSSDHLIPISTLEEWARPAFEGTQQLNHIQSKVFHIAYKTSENMLICAPTGAGKTNIAMLTFLQLVKQYVTSDGMINKNFKAIYIAPMKALAQEIVTKFSQKLKKLQLIVREFTGDMQLSRQEVAESQLIVTTPEKWDVVTRKGGDGSLGTLVSLIIIDEIHLLAEDRGAVIETIVARTQRYIETSQSFIRIVGLSATLPNYHDVASFLRVNPTKGLFFFGSEYRPVPLDQTFIGINEKQKLKRNNLMNFITYEKVILALQKNKQIMIFVHSRNETGKTIQALREFISKYNSYELFQNNTSTSSSSSSSENNNYSFWKKEMNKSKNQEIQNYFDLSMGIHHAGMLRSDRNLIEQLFEKGLIKVLCCTATLAWGVNLPAHTVIIKGTELYDPERGGFVDLSILDVFQIFGRAGRPQYDTSGHAIMITPHKSLASYLSMLASQAPIESCLIKALPDHLNAEIVNGTITNLKEASSWLSYTFLFIRMIRNPLVYGMSYDEWNEDPRLEEKRIKLVKEAASVLDRAMMIRYDSHHGNLSVTDLGRIASHYYIKHETIEAFNHMLTAHLSTSDALHVLCSSTEFDQLKVRPEELSEMDELKKNTQFNVKALVDDTAGKVNILLQNYIDHSRIKSFTLVSDTNYVAQNASRISRALFEICLKRGWATMAHLFLLLSKSIDRRVGMDQHPLRQFPSHDHGIPHDIIVRLEKGEADVHRLIEMSAMEISQFCHSQKSIGTKILNFISKLPYVEVEVLVQPITRGILKIILNLSPQFDWTDRYHGTVETFWIWIEDNENEYIYHSEQYHLYKKQYTTPPVIELIIPIREPIPTQYFLRVVSDRWVGCENLIPISFQHLILPETYPPHTSLLDIHPIPITALGNDLYQSLYSKYQYFNPIQSQTFHLLYHSDMNILVGAPTGSGKTITSEMAILRLLSTYPGLKAVYVAPLKALARERVSDWKQKLGGVLGLNVVELTGDVTPDLMLLNQADIIITTPEKWDGITRGWAQRDYVQKVGLMIIDEIHLLGVDRGPILEIIVSRMRYISTQTNRLVRIVGLSTALANARDLADWMGIQEIGMYNFRPSVRPIPMSIYIQGFPGKHYCPRMATMNKPAYSSILEHSPNKPVLIFVSSRRQTRLTALDLISYCASDDNPKQFLHLPEEEILSISHTLRDSALKDTIVFGIGIHHAGLDSHDRMTVEELFVTSKIQILVCTSTLAWGVNFPAHLVIIKGTEFFDGKVGRYVDFPVTDVLQMMGRAGRPQYDETGIACIFVHETKKNFYKKFLHEPFPVESSLHKQFHNHLNADIASGRIKNLIDCVDYFSWTYLFRRIVRNPSYYGLQSAEPQAIHDYLLKMIQNTITDLVTAQCIIIDDEENNTSRDSFKPSVLGIIASTYYLDYKSVGLFRQRLTQLQFDHEHDKGEISDLVLIMSDAVEFSLLPVRHNEEHLNANLAAVLPWETSQMNMEDSHTKTYLLLQAHFFHATLPISDYLTDLKSVLDQAPRVLNGMIDVTADSGYLELTLRLMRLSQMIFQVCLNLILPFLTSVYLPLSLSLSVSVSHRRDWMMKVLN
jgi:activating signal cointegrator complex subunit 3